MAIEEVMDDKEIDPNLLSPDKIMYEKIKMFYAKDTDLNVLPYEISKDGYIMTIKIECTNAVKTQLLNSMMNTNIDLGDNKHFVKTEFVFAGDKGAYYKDIYEVIFANNAKVDRIAMTKDQFGTNHTFAICDPVALQFKADDTGDINGLRSVLYQDAATELFGGDEFFHFCTIKVED